MAAADPLYFNDGRGHFTDQTSVRVQHDPLGTVGLTPRATGCRRAAEMGLGIEVHVTDSDTGGHGFIVPVLRRP